MFYKTSFLIINFFLYRNLIFRRSSATHFGCALLIKAMKPYKAYFVCVYCTKLGDISTQLSYCPSDTAKDTASEFPNLCIRKEYRS